MKLKKQGLLITAALTIATGGWAQSESMRPLFTRENRFPERYKAELGSYVNYRQDDEYFVSLIDSKSYKNVLVSKTAAPKLKTTTVAPYAKFGVYENLTAYATVPFSFVKSDARGKRYEGVNDLALGLELLAYEYTYKYPWIIPYIEVTLPTGDDERHLGRGEVDPIFGAAIGTTTFDKYTWVLDGRYDANVYDDGRFEGAVAFVWELSRKFSILAEVKAMEKAKGSPDDVPVYFNGGMCYRPIEPFSINLYGGSSVNAEEDGHGTLKLAYSF